MGTLHAAHKILIVDDDHDTHQYIADVLEHFGYEVDCVHRADLARALIPRVAPDFLILDLNIEERHAGWTLLQTLRADPATSTIPVVLATSDHAFIRSHRQELRASGALVLEKPFAPDTLVKLVAAALEAGQ